MLLLAASCFKRSEILSAISIGITELFINLFLLFMILNIPLTKKVHQHFLKNGESSIFDLIEQ